MRVALCLPTLNANTLSAVWFEAFFRQTLEPSDLLVIDSSSTDQTAQSFDQAGFSVRVIPRSSFNHGATRQLAVDLLPQADVIIFMTQDALLADKQSLENLVKVFDNPQVGAVFGRQLPASDATPIAAHARLFNYPAESYVRDKSDIPRYGIKTAFLSNSFAAYRRSALLAVGGFPSNAILSEDTMVATRMLLYGWKIAYCAEACCYHSHNYSMWQEFQRYFDIGVFHGREAWYCKALGAAEGEGMRFVRSEQDYLWRHAPLLIPSALLRTVLKFSGYRLGKLERLLPIWFKRLASMNKGFWNAA